MARLSAVLKPAVAHIRVLKLQDLAAVMAIEVRAYPFPWTLNIFNDCLKSGHSGLALTRDDVLIGYGMLSAAAGEAHLLNVTVAPELQGQGHGRHLVKRLIDLARWHRAQRLFLEVRASNTRAIDLYFSLGFNEIGQRPNYYPGKSKREHAQVMALELLPAEL